MSEAMLLVAVLDVAIIGILGGIFGYVIRIEGRISRLEALISKV